jgi:soluble lytic murein transglycosylase
MKKNTILFTIIFISLINLPCKAADIESTRKQYLRAEKALAKGRYDAYQKEKVGLEQYPLYPYLQYGEMRHKLVRANSDEVNKFLAIYSDTWFGQDIRNEWLQILARRQNWDGYLAAYIPSTNSELTCHYLNALYHEKNEVDEDEFKKIWFRGRNLPKACEPMVAVWKEKGFIDHDAVLARVELAIKSNNIVLAKELIATLSKEQSEKLENWLHKKDDTLISAAQNPHEPITDLMLYHSLQRITESDLENGIKALDTLSACYSINEQHEGEILSNIAVRLASRNDPRAAEWLDQIPDDYTTKTAREWRIREAIRRHDWNDVLKWTALLPPDESNQEIWLYWRGRAWEKLDAPHKARRLYGQAAQVRSYYGFLAAQRLDRKLPLNHKDVPISEDMLQEAALIPGVQRAKELYLLGQLGNARREWESTISQLPAPQQMAAAKLAHSWAWHDSALMTANKTDLIDDLTIRFPVPHLETVLIESQKRSLDPALVYGIIRQESAFMPDARSHAGALGLMQVLPGSAKDFAVRVWKEPAPTVGQLYTPEYNIRVGSAYITSLMKEFDGQIAPAIAAYNAGPGRVKKWMPEDQAIPTDEWIETVPYFETREYLQHVLAYLVIYSNHLNGENKSARNYRSKNKEFVAAMVTPIAGKKVAQLSKK